MNQVSIIVVNYNGKKWLKKCIDSLLKQTYKNFEVICVDNNSTDDSVLFIQKNYSNQKVKVIESSKNLGFAGGNNLGIAKSSGEFIMLLNNDAWVDYDFIEKIVNFYENHNFDLIAPRENDYENKNHYKYSFSIDPFGHPVKIDYLRNDKSFYLKGVCLLFKKELYLETKGLDNDFFMYFEETDWFWRLNLLGKTYAYADHLVVHHAGSGGMGEGILQYNSFLWRNQNCLQMLLKNYLWSNLWWVVPIYLAQNIFEILFFLFIMKPKIAFSYVEGWVFNLQNLHEIFEKRKWIQDNRVFGDGFILKKMYFGFGKINHLKEVIKYRLS